MRWKGGGKVLVNDKVEYKVEYKVEPTATRQPYDTDIVSHC